MNSADLPDSRGVSSARPSNDSGASQRSLSTRSDSAISETEDDDLEHIPMQLHHSDSSSSISFVDLSKLLLVPDFDFGFDHVSDSTKKKFSDMKNRTKERLRSLPRVPQGHRFSSKDMVKYQESLNKRLNKFDKVIQENLQSSATEKAFYAFAVSLVAAGGFIIGKYPTYFPVFHTVIFCLLIPIRFYTYFKQSFQYYLADLCYYVNMLLLLFLWVFPNSKSLFVSVFSLTFGTLSFAVITWRNSLVLHSIEKTTSSIIHIMPPITMFTLVHEMPKEYIAERYPAICEVESWNFFNGILVTSVYYTIWQVCYHYFITVRRREQIAKGRVTSFTYLKKRQSKSPLGKLVNSLPYTWMQVGAFTLIQFMYQILTMLPCPIWFKYKHLCGSFNAFVFAWSAYNGATYYVEVFGKRFEKEVKHLRTEINDLQSRLATQATERASPSTSPLVQPMQPLDNVEELVPSGQEPGKVAAH